jgi:hypothetical protein
VDAEPQIHVTEALAEFELLVFGSTLADDDLAQKLLAADATFNAHVVARLASEPVILH